MAREFYHEVYQGVVLTERYEKHKNVQVMVKEVDCVTPQSRTVVLRITGIPGRREEVLSTNGIC